MRYVWIGLCLLWSAVGALRAQDVATIDIMPAENLEVVASWDINLFNLTFVSGDDGVFVGGAGKLTHVVSHGEATPPAPVVVPRAGLVFAGWDGDLPTTLSGDLRLTALYALDVDDSDGDLLPDSWVLLHFGQDGASADDDPDEDGYSNWEEFISNTDPNNSQDHPVDRAIPIWHDAVYKLRTIGLALRRYSDEHGFNVFPGRLQFLVDDGYLPAAVLASIGDESFGTDPHPYDAGQFPEAYEPGVSFFYEMSEAPCSWSHIGTWYETKMQQFQSGASWPITWDEGRGPFDPRAFPVVRNFWVPDDLGKIMTNKLATSLNLAMDLKTVFASTSQWEDQSTIIQPDDAPVLRLAANDFYSYPVRVSYGGTIRIPLWFAVRDLSSAYGLRLVPPEGENQTIYGELHGSYYLLTPGRDTPEEFTVRVEWHDGEALRSASFSIRVTDWPPVISFDSSGGTPVEDIWAMPGEPLLAPSPPTRYGYTFLGWEPPLPETMPNYALMVNALWMLNTYTMTYLAGEHGSVNGQDEYRQPCDHGSDALLVTAQPADGYRFVRWSDGIQSATRTDTNVQSDQTITAEFAVKFTPVVSWAAPAAMVYGEVLSAEQLVATADTPGVFVYDPPAGTQLAAGTHTLHVTFTPDDAVNWSPAEATVEISVARAALTVTADDMTRRVGQRNPTFTATASGLVADDSLAGIGLELVYACIADEQSAPGDYAITLSGPAETANYTVTYVPAVLKVVARDVPTLTWAAPAAMVYGEVLSAEQLVATADTPGGFVYDPPAGTTLAAGTHTLRVTFTPDDAVNWSPAEATVAVDVVAGVSMALSVAVPGAAAPDLLVFGEIATAANGLDAWDEFAEPGLSAHLLCYDDLVNPPRVLQRDFRSVPADGISRWRVQIGGGGAEAGAGGAAVDLTWDIRVADVGRGVFVQQIVDEQPVGTMYDLRELENGVLTVSANSEWEIVSAAVAEAGYFLRCKSGWNLVGMPMMSTAADAEELAKALEVAGANGIWYWENGRYRLQRRVAAVSPERGYWLYSAVDTELGPIRGVRADGVVLLKLGWNLVSPVNECKLQLPVGASATTWQGDNAGYMQLRTGMVLQEGRGYWVFCSQGEVRVQFASE